MSVSYSSSATRRPLAAITMVRPSTGEIVAMADAADDAHHVGEDLDAAAVGIEAGEGADERIGGDDAKLAGVERGAVEAIDGGEIYAVGVVDGYVIEIF